MQWSPLTRHIKGKYFFLNFKDLCRASASKSRRIMSAVGTILLHSPGWNEGKARNGTLGKHKQQIIWAPMRSGTTVWAFVLDRVVPPLKGFINILTIITQGFISNFALIIPWGMQKCRPYRAHLRFHHQSITLLFWCACPGVSKCSRKKRFCNCLSACYFGKKQYLCSV